MRIRKLVMVLAVALLSAGLAEAQEKGGTGNIDVRSSLVGGRVYIDNEYKGDADIYIEDVKPGEHSITVRQGGQTVSGQFILRSNETMMLEARFDEGRVVDLKDIAREESAKRAEAERKAEADRKKKEEVPQAKPVDKKKPDQKKAVAVVVPKPQKSADDERRDVYLSLIRVNVEEAGAGDMKVTQKINAKTVTNFNDSKNVTGKIYRSKQNFLLCETAPCNRDWNGRFFYIDETGKRDAFLIRWKETVFTGVTPQGTSKLEMDLCLNGDCKRLTYPSEGAAPAPSAIDRYVLSWTKTAFIIRRADLLKEITDAGGKVPEF